MRQPPLLQVRYRDQTFRLPANALGGTRTAPLLKPAEVLLLDWAYATGKAAELEAVTLLHDRAGVLCTCVRARQKILLSDNLLHAERMQQVYAQHHQAPVPLVVDLLEDNRPGTVLNLLHVPKSMALFEQYLAAVARTAGPETRLAAAFQTRYFTPQMLAIAEKYAAGVEQSRAFKKARLLLLRDFYRPEPEGPALDQLTFGGVVYEQYPGVFSAGHIDYATQFLLEEWAVNPLLGAITAPATIIDVGCGNGVIGDQLLARYPQAHLTATDVSCLARASTRRNLAAHGFSARATVVAASSLAAVVQPERVDLIVTNPPFHDGFQTDISVALEIFQTASERLTATGYLVVVANRHLNYATHLNRYFDEVFGVAENDKFVIYRCR